MGSAIPPNNAVSVYTQDAMDDFPVLKAFQQYIDAEQAKARKRLLSLGIFFGILTGAIIAVFVVMLVNMTARNQQLNDRLVEYAMKDRDRQAAVVAQPPQDNSAILALTAKLDDMQKKLEERLVKAEKEAEAAAERARQAAAEATEREKAAAQIRAEQARLEQIRLEKEQARLEKERAAAEKERKRQEELEAYRRKHYPELYGLPKTLPSQHRLVPASSSKNRKPVVDEEIDDDLLPDDDSAIDYFDKEDVPAPKAKKQQKQAAAKPKAKTVEPPKAVEQPKTVEQPAEQPYVIPVEVKGKNSNFRIPI